MKFLQKSCSITLVGTIKHNDMVTCIEWSPKGKQLIVGDISGYIKQYKPEMILVRVTPPPTDIVSLKGVLFNCLVDHFNSIQYDSKWLSIHQPKSFIDVKNYFFIIADENALRCVGISWLATTDFLIAYSSKTGQKVNISKLCVKKDAPPQWTHFDDINFCGDKSTFDQRVEFTQLMGWKLVLCSSSRSSEVRQFFEWEK